MLDAEGACPIRCLLPSFDDENGFLECKAMFKLVIQHLMLLVLGENT